MNNTKVSSKELELLVSIGGEGAPSQRSLSEKLGLSLGITNLLLRRLIGRGYIKVTALNGRSVRYILTPKGFSEKLQKTYAYAQRTLQEHQRLRGALERLVEREQGRGHHSFLVAGEGELAELLGLVLEARGAAWRKLNGGPAEGLVLVAAPEARVPAGASRVNVLEELVL